MWVQSLGWEDSPETGMATHSRILAWRVPQTDQPSRLQCMGSRRVGHDSSMHTVRKDGTGDLTLSPVHVFPVTASCLSFATVRVTRGRLPPLSSTDLCTAPRPPASTWPASQCGRAGWDSRAPAGCPRSAVSAGQPQPAAHCCSSPRAPCGPAREAPRRRPGPGHGAHSSGRCQPLSSLHPPALPRALQAAKTHRGTGRR